MIQYHPTLSNIIQHFSNIIQHIWRLIQTRQEVNESCVEEWSSQLSEALELLRSLRPQGAKVNVSCQMGPLVPREIGEKMGV